MGSLLFRVGNARESSLGPAFLLHGTVRGETVANKCK